MSREKIKQQLKELSYSNLEITNKYIEVISKIIALYIGKKITVPKELVDQFVKCLEEVYKNTSSRLKDIYFKVKKFEIEDILDLTYQDDNKTLDERIQEYWSNASNTLNQSNRQTIVISLINKYNILLNNESLIVQRHVIQSKIAPVASILVIEGSDDNCRHGKCSEYIGEWPANEDIPLPPYHPSCTCFFYYLETDDIDDIKDLDLEIER